MFQKSVSGYNEESWLAEGLSYAAELFEQRGTCVTWPRGGKMNSKLSMDSKDIQTVKLTDRLLQTPRERVGNTGRGTGL